jgi:ubiquinone/menaquinone biosynthesis C-methylase UbiE
MSRCDDCGLLFLNPQPTPEQLSEHYPADYYSYDADIPNEALYTRLYQTYFGPTRRILDRLAFLPYRLVLRTMVGGPGQKVLDVGCGSGQYLAMLKKVHDVAAYGVEPYSFNPHFARENGLQIFNGSLEDAQFPDAYFDGITLNAVFEHLPDPAATLRELRRIMKPNGSLVIMVPQSRCLLYWLFGKHWWQLDVPRHLTIPSANNLRQLAEATGFRVRSVRYNSTPTSIMATLFYWRTQSQGKYFHEFGGHWWAFRALLPVSWLLNALRIGDQFEMILTAE